jgi:membrane-bound serine protease (ClpP class)
MSTFGVVLMVVGATLMVAEAHVASHGVLSTTAAALLAAGVALVLSGAGIPGAVVLAAALGVGAAGLGLAWLLLVKSLAARRLRVRSGPPALLGRVATVRTIPAPVGQVQLDGTLWRARLSELEADDAALAEGCPVVVESVHGLTLTVRPAEEWEVLP